VKFVGKISNKTEWPTVLEAAAVGNARTRPALRNAGRVKTQCLPVALSVHNDDVSDEVLPALMDEDEAPDGRDHVLAEMLDGGTLPAGSVLLDSCSATCLGRHNLLKADGRHSDMVLKGVGPDVVKAVHVIDIALEACSSYQNERRGVPRTPFFSFL
jgi:hypothetical protein